MHFFFLQFHSWITMKEIWTMIWINCDTRETELRLDSFQKKEEEEELKRSEEMCVFTCVDSFRWRTLFVQRGQRHSNKTMIFAWIQWNRMYLISLFKLIFFFLPTHFNQCFLAKTFEFRLVRQSKMYVLRSEIG